MKNRDEWKVAALAAVKGLLDTADELETLGLFSEAAAVRRVRVQVRNQVYTLLDLAQKVTRP